MKFIFPKNYDFKSKLFGVFDYITLLIDIIYFLFIFSICNLLFINIYIKTFIIISLCFPILLLSIFGLNNENVFTVLIYILKYFLKPKLYLYNKSTHTNREVKI